VKLFYAFQTKDHLYLVMEYLIGGDCASLLRALLTFEEDMARHYVAEVFFYILLVFCSILLIYLLDCTLSGVPSQCWNCTQRP
jgi:serine/threonine protein kinase